LHFKFLYANILPDAFHELMVNCDKLLELKHEKHEYLIKLDQSYLPGVIRQLEKIVAGMYKNDKSGVE